MNATDFLKTSQFWLFIFLSCYFSLAPQPADIIKETPDKVLHAAGYFLLLISCNIAYRTGSTLPVKIILLFAFSLSMEIFQHFIPNRHFSLLDLLANLGGLSAASIVLILVRGKGRRLA